jgi:molybdopterin-containing oxidoreductase family iron-sulfur binding subunit
MSNQSQQPDQGRRSFLSSTALTALAASIPGLTLFAEPARARPADQPVSDKVRWGMLVDTEKCGDGCTACVQACNDENGLQSNGRPLSDPQWIRAVTVRDKLTGRETDLPLMCQHCEHPPCVDVCPTGASFRRADGIVLVDKHICIGCRYCMMACPYKARSFIHEVVTDQKPYAPRGKGTVESCTFCVHRVDAGRQPACVEACAKDGGGALVFGDLKDPNSALYRALTEYPTTQIRADLGLNTGVRYHGI